MTSLKSSGALSTASVLSAIAASLCCITPIVALLAGSSSIAANLAWIEPARSYLIVLSIVVLAFAWYRHLRQNKSEGCCQLTKKKSFFQSTFFLVLVTVISAILISFPYWATALFDQSKNVRLEIGSEKSAVIEVKIEGMTCEACTLEVNDALKKVKGVISYSTSYPEAKSTIKFDSIETNQQAIETAINKTGYTVVKTIYKPKQKI